MKPDQSMKNEYPGLRHFLSCCTGLCLAISATLGHGADLPPAALQALRQANVPPSAISVQVTPLGSSKSVAVVHSKRMRGFSVSGLEQLFISTEA